MLDIFITYPRKERRIKTFLLSTILITSIFTLSLAQNYVITEYGIDEGLNTTDLNCIAQDQEGFLWTGSSIGISKFDGVRFINYSHIDSLRIGNTTDLITGKGKDLLIGTSQGLLLRSQLPQKSKVKVVHLKNKEINDITTSNSTIWVAADDGIYKASYFEESKIGSFEQILSRSDVQEKGPKVEFISLELDTLSNELWFGTYKSLYSYVNGKLTTLWDKSVPGHVWSIKKINGEIIFSTKYYGAFRFRENKVTSLFKSQAYTRDISSSDKNWQIIHNDSLYLFENNHDTPSLRISLNDHSQKFLFTSLQDHEGNFWVVTKEGVLNISGAKFNALNIDTKHEIYSIFTNNDEKILGTNRGQIYSLSNLNYGTCKKVCQLPTKAEIFDIVKFKNHFYLATGYSGIFVLNTNFQIKDHITDLVTPSVYKLKTNDNEVYAIGDQGYTILNADSANIKIQSGPRASIVRFNDLIQINGETILSSKDGLFIKNENDLKLIRTGNQLLDQSNFTSLALHHGNQFFLSTLDQGILVCEFNSNTIDVIKTIDVSSGLLSNNVLNINIFGNYLVANCYSGISIFELNSEMPSWHSQLSYSNGFQFKNFKSSDLSLTNDTIWFASTKGIGHFPKPKPKSLNKFTPRISRVGYSIKEEKLEFKNIISDNLNIPYGSDQITIEYASHILTDSKNKLTQNRLTNFDLKWSEPNTNGTRYLGKLNPGKYLFQVRDLNSMLSSDILWIKIPHPWYQTWYAYLLWISGILTSIFLLYRFRLSRKLAQEEARRLQELNTQKTNFFNKITHDFRTPLTIINNELFNIEGQKESKNIIRRNSDHLIQLINKILTINTTDKESASIDMIYADVLTFIRHLSIAFESMAQSQQKSFQFIGPEDSFFADFDPGMLQRVIYNLIDNALKHTKKGDAITIEVASLNQRKQWELTIIDTGSGIPQEHLDKINDLYFHSHGEGYGIGLHIISQYVKNLDGSMKVISQLGEGSQFKLLFPVTNNAPHKDWNLISTSDNSSDNHIILPQTDETHQELILIVEDNNDLRRQLIDIFASHYNVINASNGKEAIEMVRYNVPDLIISDIMMPTMDGVQMLESLKKHEIYNRIPCIMLTARASEVDLLEGLESGADAYLTKPFDPQELQLRVENLLQLLKNQRNGTLDRSIPQKMGEPQSNVQIEFLNKVNEIISKNVSDSDLRVADICSRLNTNPTSLNKRMRLLTGITMSAYLRKFRMSHARDLITSTNQSLSEICYQVGISDPAYFTKLFKKEFGILPSEVRDV